MLFLESQRELEFPHAGRTRLNAIPVLSGSVQSLKE